MNLKDKNVVVIGMGASGLASARALVEREARVVVMDTQAAKMLKEPLSQLSRLGVKTVVGGYDQELLREAGLVVISPGVPTDLSALRVVRLRSIPVISEVELAYQINSDPFIIAVTGTNGKTTTVTLIGEILKRDNLSACGHAQAGRKVKVAGNIGLPLVEEIKGAKSSDFVVTEVSSFQLETIDKFRPKISLILNVTPDHLERHKSFKSYLEAKKRIFLNQQRGDYLILNLDDPATFNLASQAKAKVIFFSQREELKEGAYIGKGPKERIVVNLRRRSFEVCKVEEVRIKGRHNLENVLASCIVSFVCGVELNNLRLVLKEFPGLEHRQERVAEVKGREFINDSKGTNPAATIRALEAFTPPIILIAGGKDKGLKFDGLAKVILKKVKALIVLGEAAGRMKEEFSEYGFSQIKRVSSLKEAVNLSFRLANSGEVVLFSPACSSFDMFSSFEERGEVFKEEVRKLKGRVEDAPKKVIP